MSFPSVAGGDILHYEWRHHANARLLDLPGYRIGNTPTGDIRLRDKLADLCSDEGRLPWRVKIFMKSILPSMQLALTLRYFDYGDSMTRAMHFWYSQFFRIPISLDSKIGDYFIKT